MSQLSRDVREITRYLPRVFGALMTRTVNSEDGDEVAKVRWRNLKRTHRKS